MCRLLTNKSVIILNLLYAFSGFASLMWDELIALWGSTAVALGGMAFDVFGNHPRP